LFAELAAYRAVRVALSLTTLDQSLARVMEPRTSAPAARLKAVARLKQAGVPVEVIVGPVVPGLNDSELPAILHAASEAGAEAAHYLVLRLPTTVRHVFLEWLERHRPNHAQKVTAFIRDMRAGQLNSGKFGERHRGQGVWADQIEQTFRVFAARYGLAQKTEPLNADAFLPPRSTSGQQWLF
ncbi:MAG: radical SAM protein, partial [Planctomycetales bacterium]|nr:radical SAM protein [Planctomycetales bacterium]